MNGHEYGSRYERQLEWYSNRAMLLDVHDNVVAIVQLYARSLLGLLERFDKAAQLESMVLAPLHSGDYAEALDALRDFVLADETMFKLFPQLIDRAEPGLQVLADLASEYELW